MAAGDSRVVKAVIMLGSYDAEAVRKAFERVSMVVENPTVVNLLDELRGVVVVDDDRQSSTDTNDDTSLAAIIAENSAIRQQRQCLGCKKSVADVILMPCRHVVKCTNCHNAFVHGSVCPRCGADVAGSFNIFWCD